MRHLILFVFICTTLQGISQSSSMMGKISPGVLFPKKSSAMVTGFGTFGLNGKFFGAGASVGCFKLKDEGTSIIPLGVEIFGMNFRQKKITPYASLGAYYPIMNDGVKVIPRSASASPKGKYFFKTNLGIGFPLSAQTKIVFSGSYNYLAYKSGLPTAGVPPQPGTSSRAPTRQSIDASLWGINLELIF